MAALNLAIAVASGLVLAGVLASKLSSRVGIPSLLLFLAVGMLAGSDGIGRIDFDNAELAQSLGVTALAFILFAGGLDTSWSSVRPVLGQAVVMATAGVLATALIVGAVAVWVLGVPLWTGLLVGAIVSSTDAAAVFVVLRSRSVSLRDPIRPLLELESGSNDPMAVFLPIGFLELVTERSSSLFELIPMFAAQMAVGGVVFPGSSQRPRMPRGSPPGGMAAVEPRSLSRRQLLGGLLTLPAIGVLLSACSGGDAATTATTGSTGSTGSTGAGAASSTAAGSGSSAATASTTATAAAPTTAATAATVAGWAAGGTDLITVGYPATSLFSTGNPCRVSLTEATTEGPCYFASDTGEDISQGKTGLPAQLCLQLVDSSCAPLAGHVIEAWHCDTRGIYSGDTGGSADAGRFAGDFCTAGDAEAEQSTYFRGQLTTDVEGRVNFKTCFPGWYAGRTIHIHFAVSDAAGTTRVISQFCFTDELAEAICTTHPLYADRGVQDTTLAGGRDSVFPQSGFEPFLLSTRRNSDGTLLCYGVIQIDPRQA
ncbi:MAG: cation:proton antiporter [Acidimicrobiia bacterium]